MTDAFIALLNMSITAGWLILAVILLRVLLKNAPKKIRCLLWALVGIRLVCPLSLESVFSLIPSREVVSPDIVYSQSPSINSGIPSVNSAVNNAIAQTLTPAVEDSVNPMQIVALIASVIWVIGVVAMLIYTLISFLKLKKRVGASVVLRDNIRLCDNVKSPFILGVIKPKIYLPSDMDEAQSSSIIAHETAHLKRHDHLWKPLGFLLLSVYWFNPLCWAAYWLLCKDIELACDERVIKDMDIESKKDYSNALLTYSVSPRGITACPLAFGEVGVKERIKGVLNYKKPTFWIVAISLAACFLVTVCLMTNPQSKSPKLMGAEYTVDTVMCDLAQESAEQLDYMITADKLLYIKNAQSDEEWKEVSGLNGHPFSRERLLSMVGDNWLSKYRSGDIEEAYIVEHDRLIFSTEKGDVYLATGLFGTAGGEKLTTLYKLKSSFESQHFYTDFFDKSLMSSAGNSYVNSFAFYTDKKLKGYAAVGFLAGESSNPDEMTDIGFALLETDGKGYSLVDCKSYENAAESENGIYLCPYPLTIENKTGKWFDVVLSCAGKLAKVEKTFNGKTQIVEVTSSREMILLDIYDEEYDEGAAKATYKFYGKDGNELKYSGSIVREPGNEAFSVEAIGTS